MSNNTEFKWDDASVLEFVQFTLKNSPLLQGRYTDMEQFKESKQRKPLFRTEDGVDVFEGDSICLLSTDNWLTSYPVKAQQSPFKGDHNQFKYYSTKEAADLYILYNKPLITLNEIKEIGQIEHENVYFVRLKQLARKKHEK